MFRKMAGLDGKTWTHLQEKAYRRVGRVRKADVIIPTFKPGISWKTSAAAVGTECAGGYRVIIMNTEESTGMLSGLSPYLRKDKADRVPYPPVGI